jgi:hypothetical protein
MPGLPWPPCKLSGEKKGEERERTLIKSNLNSVQTKRVLTDSIYRGNTNGY